MTNEYILRPPLLRCIKISSLNVYLHSILRYMYGYDAIEYKLIIDTNSIFDKTAKRTLVHNFLKNNRYSNFKSLGILY